MKTPAGALLSALLAFVLFALEGCGSSPPVRFFTLASEPAPQTAAAAVAYSVAVGPVTVPEIVDRPQLVLRTSSTQVEVAEQARWAAPLKSEIPRVIADQLARLLPGATMATSSARAVAPPDYRVSVDIDRFDSTLRENATIGASWTVRTREGTVRAGRSIASEPAGAGYDELVAAHSRALNTVSRDIAAVILELRK